MNLEQKIIEVPLEDILPNRFQPRLEFDDRGLEELAASIKEHGIIQPLVLRRIDDKYEIIAGERRFKAASLAGLKTVPAVIANIDDNKSAEVAIVENVQRRDLTPIEEARSFKKMIDKGYTQSDLAKKMGISQSAIANKLRLLNLAEEVQDALLNNKISERHARSLLTLSNKEDQIKWLNKIIDERLTVRALDDLLKEQSKSNIEDNPNTDDSDVPLIKALDIDAIKKEATELPKINDSSNFNQKMEQLEREKLFNPDIIPVEQTSNNSKNNFFNFLENETVNMNVEEADLKAPVITFNNQPKEENEVNTEPSPTDIEKPEIEETEKEPIEPKKDEPVITLTKEEPKPIEEEATPPVEPINQVEESSVLNPNFGSIEDNNDDEDVFDPIDLIDTLDPNYEEKQEEKLGIDLKSAIKEIRNLKDDLSDRGYKINLEETDLDDIYQFTIKINK